MAKFFGPSFLLSAVFIGLVGCDKLGCGKPAQNPSSNPHGSEYASPTHEATADSSGGLQTQPDEDKRPITEFGAKAALARLELYLRQQGKPPIKGIWHATPSRSALFRFNNSLSRAIGGWMFEYEDSNARMQEALVNCYGEISTKDFPGTGSSLGVRAITLDEFVVDNADANAIVIRHGGEASSGGLGGWLMAIKVEGRGIRPAWAGSEWFSRQDNTALMVDAQTGELYKPLTEDSMQPLDPRQVAPLSEWDGGFDASSTDALMSRSEHFYWWPLAYQDSEQNFIYNRALLNQKLNEEQEKPTREASSWMTTGILHAALGDWVNAAGDLDKAVDMAPNIDDYRYYRGIIYAVIRDLDKAESDFESLPPSRTGRSDAINLVAMMRGEKDSGGLLSSMFNVQTDVGFVPLNVTIGPLPLESMLSDAPDAGQAPANQ